MPDQGDRDGEKKGKGKRKEKCEKNRRQRRFNAPIFSFAFFVNLPAAAEAVKSAQNFAVLLRRSVDAEISNLVPHTSTALLFYMLFSLSTITNYSE